MGSFYAKYIVYTNPNTVNILVPPLPRWKDTSCQFYFQNFPVLWKTRSSFILLLPVWRTGHSLHLLLRVWLVWAERRRKNWPAALMAHRLAQKDLCHEGPTIPKMTKMMHRLSELEIPCFFSISRSLWSAVVQSIRGVAPISEQSRHYQHSALGKLHTIGRPVVCPAISKCFPNFSKEGASVGGWAHGSRYTSWKKIPGMMAMILFQSMYSHRQNYEVL